MNKQELIKEVKEIGIYSLNLFSTVVEGIPTKTAIKLIKQLDEPQPVKVPQFVADWIEYCKVKKITLAHALYRSEEAENKNVFSWIVKDSGNQETFARAWLDGYEVEKEKRYLVKMKGIDTNFNFLNRHRNENYWIFSSKDKNTLYQTHHTRKELEEAGLGWVFDCPGIEVEEVGLCH